MRRFFLSAILLVGSLLPLAAFANSPGREPEIIISVNDQQLKFVRNGLAVASFPISTSRFGLGDSFRSYKTPVGTLQVCAKEGGQLPMGAVLKGGHFTGEILAPNAPGRDPIVTRILRLQGLESQNRNALTRGIMIHGTPEEGRIGKPASFGCIRMRSRDVVELYKLVEVGTKVIILNGNRGPQHEVHRESAFASNGWWS